ncbi:MAG: methyltransferase family protein [Elusimicrobiales bacterium]
MSIAKKRIFITEVFLIVLVLFFKPVYLMLFILGLIFVLSGIILRLTSSMCIRKNKILSTKGPYSLCRNPLYLGSFLIFIGVMIQVSSLNLKTILMWVLYPLVFIYIYINQINMEEKKLCEKFGDEYIEYKKNTPCIIPNKISSLLDIFDWKNYSLQAFIKNKEYKTLILIIFLEIFFYLRLTE